MQEQYAHTTLYQETRRMANLSLGYAGKCFGYAIMPVVVLANEISESAHPWDDADALFSNDNLDDFIKRCEQRIAQNRSPKTNSS